MAIKTAFKRGLNFRWVVPQISPEIWSKKQQFKCQILEQLLASKTAKKGIKYYSIAIESHADGNPHLDMLLIFKKDSKIGNNQLDFLCQKHGNLTRYRSLNQAILEYGSKEDTPLNNCPEIKQLLEESQLKKDPYAFLQEHMLKDPYEFNLAEFVQQNNYAKYITNWSSIKAKLKDIQEARCNRILKSKPGIRFIDKKFIQSTLSKEQLDLFYSWSGYQQIIDFLNQIPTYGTKRPFKTPNLLLVGPSNVGKTSLILQIQKYTSVYPVGTQNWFPKFSNHTYKLMFWDQWVPSMMPWEAILMLLQGLPMDLPFKGGSILKYDNQLWIMTSNQNLESQITKIRKYLGYDCVERSIAALKTRILQIMIPENKPLFILQKLIRSKI